MENDGKMMWKAMVDPNWIRDSRRAVRSIKNLLAPQIALGEIKDALLRKAHSFLTSRR